MEKTLNEPTERKPDEPWRVWLASAVEQTTDSVIITDFSFTLVRYVNQAFSNLAGYAREEVICRGRGELKKYLEEGSSYEEIQEAVAQGRTWLGRLTVRRRDGGELEVESTLSPIRDHSGRVINYVAVMRDITRYTELERQLRQAQKMEAIGALASGIAHDFNNLLWAITGYAEMALEEAPVDSETHDNLRQLLKASRRAKDLVEQILTFSRQSGQEKSHLALGPVLKEALKLIRATLPSTIDIRQEIQVEGSYVQANATQIHQVMMNLCSNAAYAMRENGGVLIVTLQPVEIDSEVAAGHPDLSPGPHLRLSVEDTGHGMDYALMQLIFEPFFTTKNPVEGTGMGLAAVNGIVKSHGGAVTVESAPGRGSVFHVFLPRAEEGVPAEEDPLNYIPSGHERILFVDDEEILVDMVIRMLTRFGYKVTGLADSRQALDAFAAAPESFDLVITDQTMPSLTGMELSRNIMSIRPDIPVIICTGYTTVVTEDQAKAIGVREFLPKPLVMEQMARLIRDVLDGMR